MAIFYLLKHKIYELCFLLGFSSIIIQTDLALKLLYLCGFQSVTLQKAVSGYVNHYLKKYLHCENYHFLRVNLRLI